MNHANTAKLQREIAEKHNWKPLVYTSGFKIHDITYFIATNLRYSQEFYGTLNNITPYEEPPSLFTTL
jgi:hypothetical protein